MTYDNNSPPEGATAQAGHPNSPENQPTKRGPGRPRKPQPPPTVKVPKLAPFLAMRGPARPMDLQPAPRSKQSFLSRESVRNIETLALRKFRHQLTMKGYDLSDLM